MTGINIVKPMRKERQKLIAPFLNILQPGSSNRPSDTAPPD
jgi:hypothetical protein